MKNTTQNNIHGFGRKLRSHKNLLLSLLFILDFGLESTGTVLQSEYDLSNDKIKLSLDDQGRLVKLENLRTGHNYLASTGHELWKMFYRTEDARELEIPAGKQKANVSRKGNTLEIAYSELTGNVALANSSRLLKIEFKVTFPDRIITNRTNSERKACFDYGFALQWRVDGMMNDTTNPEMAKYLTRLNQLRTKYADLLLDGRFVDNEGFKSQKTNLFTYAYVSGDRMAVTIWNPANIPQKPGIIAQGYSLESCNWQDPALTGPAHEVQPGDIALFVFRK